MPAHQTLKTMIQQKNFMIRKEKIYPNLMLEAVKYLKMDTKAIRKKGKIQKKHQKNLFSFKISATD